MMLPWGKYITRTIGYDERFIRPIRELRERGLSMTNPLEDRCACLLIIKMIATNNQLVKIILVTKTSLRKLAKEVTGVSEEALVLYQ